MKICSLFSGIGGMDSGFTESGFEIVYANDFDKYAVKTYQSNYSNMIECCDITQKDIVSLPSFDVLIGGFPCQPFSMMGKERGFEDARGTLFFRIAEIVKNRTDAGNKPECIVLENVRALLTHDGGNTFKVIKRILEDDLGYKVFYKVLNSADYGVPQTRNRVWIVAFADRNAEFTYPEPVKLNRTLQDVLEHDVPDKYFISEKFLPCILSNGTGGFKAKSEIDLPVARPLCATMMKMHRACQDNYVTQNGRVRRLTPRECARLQGFSDSFVIPVSDSQAYKQFGNAVTVNVAKAVAGEVRKTLKKTGVWY